MNHKEFKEKVKYQGTEKDSFIVDEPFKPVDLDHKTPFGTRWGGDIITLKPEHLEALKSGKYIAIDVEREYVAFLKLEDVKQQQNVSPKDMEEALKSADISPKSSFSKYAVAAIAKTTPCLRGWQSEEDTSDALTQMIVLNKFNKILESGGGENFLFDNYIHTPEALNEYTEDMIASGDVQKLSEALRLMQKEILKLREEVPPQG